jgi:hypothetical protein
MINAKIPSVKILFKIRPLWGIGVAVCNYLIQLQVL